MRCANSGCAGALSVGRLIANLLFEVRSTDPVVVGGVIALVAGVTGVGLAARDWETTAAFQIVLWAKVSLAVCLVIVSYVHNFVLGPRLQAEIRAGGPERSRRALVVVGWTSYALTITVPVLGVVLQQLVT